MNFFFIADRRNQKYLKIHDKIVKSFEKLGHKVDKTHKRSTSDKDSADFEKAYKRNMKSINNCDALIAEVTQLSSGIGFLISTALSQKKPVLALYNKKADIPPSITLRGTKNKYMTFNKYKTDEIEDIAQKFARKVKGMLDTKFILIISPEIDRYLDWASEYKRMHKAQIVRNAIEKKMELDEDYKKYLENPRV